MDLSRFGLVTRTEAPCSFSRVWMCGIQTPRIPGVCIIFAAFPRCPGTIRRRTWLAVRRMGTSLCSVYQTAASCPRRCTTPGAQRGINSVAAFGQNLLISNCAVGPNDKNLWYYWVDGNNYGVTLKDSVNLRVNPSAPQVFNFSTIGGVFQRPSRLLFVDRRRCALGWHN